MLTKVNHHVDPIMDAWVNLQNLLGIHRTHEHAEGSDKSYKKETLAKSNRFQLCLALKMWTHTSEENTNFVF